MRVERILPIALQRLVTIQTDASVRDQAKLLSNTHISLLVVCNPDGQMVGVVTKTDIVRQVAQDRADLDTLTTESVMKRDVTYCRPGDSVQEVLSIMHERGFVHVPIVDEESRPSGVLNVRDALQVLLAEVEQDGTFLRDYVLGVGYH